MNGETQTHRFELEQGFADDGWTAACSCGWSLPEQRSRLRALDAWENHCDVVFMEATFDQDDER